VTGLERTLIQVVRFLDDNGVPYMVIGGIANLVWGVPRATIDVDISVWVDEDHLQLLVPSIAKEFEVLVDDPVDFVNQTRVLPAKVPNGFRVDMVFAQLPYEKKAIDRAAIRRIHGVPVRICRPEDLIIHKIISERTQDLKDVEGIIRQQADQLDRQYLDPIVKGLAAELDRPKIWTHYLGCF